MFRFETWSACWMLWASNELAREIQRARRGQLDGYRRSGARVQAIALPVASHCLFVDRSRDVAKHMVTFLAQARR